jgi:broad specificity phosphatase PhoE
MNHVLAIRHAQASFDADDYDQLSARGLEQASRLAEYLAADPDFGFDAVVCGAMRRHRQTLEAIEAAFAKVGRNLPDVEIDADLNEFDHGAVMAAFLAEFPDHAGFKGQMPDKADHSGIVQFLAAALQAWAAGLLEHRLREGWRPFQRRVGRGIARLAGRQVTGGRILLVSSGGVIAQLAQHALQVPDQQAIDFNLSLQNSAISEFRVRAQQLHLKSWNTLPHLSAHADRRLWTHF